MTYVVVQCVTALKVHMWMHLALGTTIWTRADADGSDGALDLDAILGFASRRRRPRPNTLPMAQKSSQWTDPPRPHGLGKSLPSSHQWAQQCS